MGATDLIGVAGRLAELAKKGATVEAQEQIMELRALVVTLVGEKIELRERVQELESAKRLRESLRWDAKQGVYFADEATDPGPFCQVCWDKDQRLSRTTNEFEMSGTWHCAVCKHSAGPRAPYEPPPTMAW